MNLADIRLRLAKDSDLRAVNAVIASAITTWNLPARLRRLIGPRYQYDEHDLNYLTVLVAENAAGDIVGIAAWEPADPSDTPQGRKGLLLHGVYIVPELHRLGLGNRLVKKALHAARQHGFAGLLAKANRKAQGFFRATGWQLQKVEHPDRDYPYRFWLGSQIHPSA